MPPKSKSKRLREEKAKVAREAKKSKFDEPALEQQAIPPTPSTDATNTTPPVVDPEDSDRSDATYDPDKDATSSLDAVLAQFVEDWLLTLDRDTMISLGLFLQYNLTNLLSMATTKAAEYTGIMLGKSDRTVRQWKADFRENGCIPDTKQGRYQRSGILWSSEDLNKKAYKFVRENTNVKGRPNLTKHSFCHWVNDELLPNEILEPGFPRCVSVETARKWLHEMGFEVLSADKGMFFDGHEREDVVQERKEFLTKMVEYGFLHPSDAPTPEAGRAFPSSVPPTLSDVQEKTVILFHDESTFHANEDQKSMWGVKGEHMLRLKSKGVGIMVSDFVDERSGYLSLTDEEFDKASQTNPDIVKQARCLLLYGESKEGYWTNEKFMEQMKHAVAIAKIRYPKEEGW